MIESMKKILRENDLCVLATCVDDKPHCSLMGYVTDESAQTIYMVTLRSTRKYRNVCENPHVSLLVDTRQGLTGERSGIKALTVCGTFFPLREEAARQKTIALICGKHPHLQKLAGDPDAEVLAVRVESFQLLDGAYEASFEALK
jgi:nitroimidazol reductase NimA-like FMN-containing flavoprotein (pyridoxamine 5'-phosphate oxidase superfamily)